MVTREALSRVGEPKPCLVYDMHRGKKHASRVCEASPLYARVEGVGCGVRGGGLAYAFGDGLN